MRTPFTIDGVAICERLDAIIELLHKLDKPPLMSVSVGPAIGVGTGQMTGACTHHRLTQRCYTCNPRINP